MNDLSWFLYLAGTLPNLATGIGVVSMILTIIFGIISLCYIIDKTDDGIIWQKIEEYRHVWLWTIGVFLLTFVVPDKNTFYAIAASEMGEEVLNSRVGTKAQRALEAWLDAQIDDNNNNEDNSDAE